MRGVSKQPLALAFVPSGLRSPLVLTGENPQNESLMASRGELEHTHQSLCIELDLGTLRDQITAHLYPVEDYSQFLFYLLFLSYFRNSLFRAAQKQHSTISCCFTGDKTET